MNNFYLAFSVVFPLFCMMALGFTLRLLGFFNEDFLKQLNNLVFKVFLPLILFSNIYKSDFRTNFSLKTLLFAVVCIIISFVALVVVMPFFMRDKKRIAVMVQGTFRSNFIFFGIPITAQLLGENNVSTTAILIAFVIPLYNALSVVALTIFSHKKMSVKSLLMDIMKNPLIIGSFFAFIFIITGIRLPVIFEKTLFDISAVATPLAIIILGGSFVFGRLKENLKALLFCAVGKLVIMVIVFIPVAIAIGISGAPLVALFALFASPTAVSSFTMAESMGADGELAGQIVVINSIFSILTIFIGITILSNLNLF